MIRRCSLPYDPSYKWYGGRGIRVCSEWHDFETFYRWAKDRYLSGLQLDRKNGDADYNPRNCRFVTQEVNNCNRGKQKNNTTGYIGVTHRWREGNYEAKIRFRRKSIYLGRFAKVKDAVRARNEYIKSNDLPFPIQKIR